MFQGLAEEARQEAGVEVPTASSTSQPERGNKGAAAFVPLGRAAASSGSSKADIKAAAAAAASRATRLRKPKTLSPEDEDIWELFTDFDIDGNGLVDVRELQEALTRMGLPSSPQYVVQMMGQFDIAGTGYISWEGFRETIHRRDQQVEAAFRSFDLDGNGEISGAELGRCMSLAGIPSTGRDIRRMLQIMDKDGNKKISYDEFRRFACFVPSIYKTERDSIAGWLRSAPTLAPPVTEGGRPRMRSSSIATDPLQQFVAFDLLLRASMAGSLAFMILVAVRQD